MKTASQQVPPPSAWRLLLLPVALTLLVVVVVFIATIAQFNNLLAAAHAADPSETHAALLAQLWGRVVFGGVLATSWPFAMRRLSRGSTTVYARCRQASVVAAAVLLAVTLFSSGPIWLHIAHGVLTASELGIFAAAMHPHMRAWYAKQRQPNRRNRRFTSGSPS